MLSQNTNRIISVGATPYVFLVIIFGPLIYLLYLYPPITVPNLIATVVICVVVAGILLFLNSFRIYVFENKLIFKKKTILFSDISKIIMNMTLQVRTPSGKRVPAFGLCFFNSSSNSEPMAIIPAKVYSKKDLIYLMHVIYLKNPDVQLDKLCQDMSAGNFNPIAKAAIKNILPYIIWLMIGISFIPFLLSFFQRIFK